MKFEYRNQTVIVYPLSDPAEPVSEWGWTPSPDWGPTDGGVFPSEEAAADAARRWFDQMAMEDFLREQDIAAQRAADERERAEQLRAI